MILCYFQFLLIVLLSLTIKMPSLALPEFNDSSLLGACLSQPCLHGICVSMSSGGYRCYCKNGFTGLNCGTNYDDCRSNPCFNEASCVDSIESFKCMCKEGFTGEQCETDIDECESNPCENGGICEDISNGYFCNCHPGFDGTNCEENVNACIHRQDEELCKNGGTCIVGLKDTYSCSCLPEFYGDNCTLHVCPCMSGGICLKELDVTCLCPFGWTGKICETKVEFCEENVCENEGVCVLGPFSEDNYNSSSNHTCFCVPDYHGIHCEFRYNECIPEPLCNNGATCIDDVDSYSCLCPEGLTGLNCDKILDCADKNCTSYMQKYSMTTASFDLISHTQTSVTQFLISSPSINSAEADTLVFYSGLIPSFLSTSPSFTIIETVSQEFNSIFSGTSSSVVADSELCVSLGVPTESLRSCHLQLMQSQDVGLTHLDLPDYGSLFTHLSQSVIYESLLSNDELCKSTFYATDMYNFIYPVSTSCLKLDESYALQSSFADEHVSTSATVTVEDLSFISLPANEIPFTMTSDILDSKYGPGLSQMYENPSSVPAFLFTEVSIFNISRSVPGTVISVGASDILHATSYYESSSSSPILPSTASVPSSSALHVETIEVLSSLNIVPNVTDHSAEITDTMFISATNTISTLPLLSNNATENSLPDACFEFICENGGTPSTKFDFSEKPFCECVCHLLHTGPRCENEIYMLIPQFHGNSYLKHALPPLEPQKGLSVEISFMTASSEGIILFTEAISASSFLMLYIDNGMLKFSFSCGHQTTVFMETHTAVNNSYFTSVAFEITWTPHVALVKNASCNVGLLVNGSAPMSGQQYVVTPAFDFRDLFIGGTPMDMVSSISEVSKVHPLKGCVISLQINGEEKELIYDAEDGAAITECHNSACFQSPCQNKAKCRSYEDHWNCECSDGFSGPLCERKTCSANPCEHGGTCLPDNMAGYTCICPYGKHGKNCEHDLVISYQSFFGNVMGYSSYIQYAENFNSNYHLEISLTFSISDILQKSLLLFSGQTETHRPVLDFFAVGLDSGYVVYLFNLGSGTRALRCASILNSTIRIHSLLVGRHRRYGWLQVDDQRKVMGLASGHLTALNAESVLYVGGHFSYNFSLLPQELNEWKGFSGCVHDVLIRTSPGAIFSNVSSIVDGRNIQQCNISECQIIQCANGGTCVDLGSTFQCQCTEGWVGAFCTDKETLCSTGNHQCNEASVCVPLAEGYRCDCPVGRSGKYCEKNITVSDPSFGGKNSFLSFEPMNVRHSMDVRISFLPMSDSGLVFYSAQHLHELSQDFVSLLISSGLLEFRFNLGTGIGSTLILETQNKVVIGTWNIVEFGRYKRAAYLKLNDEEVTGISVPGMEILDVMTDFFLGGVPDMSAVAKGAYDQELASFHGCIRLFEVNGKVLDINSEDVISGQNIGDCDGTSCGFSTCKHGGTCVPNGESYECICPDNYRGVTCEIALPCWNHGCLNKGNCIPSEDLNYSCDCPLGWEGDRCQYELQMNAAKFERHSYLFYKDKSFDYSKSEIAFNYSSEIDNGLILWNGNIYSEDGDYLGIGLRNGHLHVVWNLGWLSRNEIMTDQLIHQKNVWHAIHIKQENQVLTLNVDETSYISQVSGDFYELNTPGDYFFDALFSGMIIQNSNKRVGGFPRNLDFKEKTGGYFSSAFIGCLKDIHVSGHQISIMNDTHGQNIEPCSMD